MSSVATFMIQNRTKTGDLHPLQHHLFKKKKATILQTLSSLEQNINEPNELNDLTNWKDQEFPSLKHTDDS